MNKMLEQMLTRYWEWTEQDLQRRPEAADDPTMWSPNFFILLELHKLNENLEKLLVEKH